MVCSARFLDYLIQTYILPASLLPQLLLNARITLFPGNSLGGPAPPIPSVKEQLAIRKQAAESILSLVPPWVAQTFFASNKPQEWIEQVEDLLEIFSQPELNRHWIYGVLELVLVRLMPELAEKGWSELLAERGVALDLHDQQQAMEKESARSPRPGQDEAISKRKKDKLEKVPPVAASNAVQKGRKIVLTGK